MWEWLAKTSIFKIDKYVVINFLIKVLFSIARQLFGVIVERIETLVIEVQESNLTGKDKFNFVKERISVEFKEVPDLLLDTLIQIIVAKVKEIKIDDYIKKAV